jgi:hypothetical protein
MSTTRTKISKPRGQSGGLISEGMGVSGTRAQSGRSVMDDSRVRSNERIGWMDGWMNLRPTRTGGPALSTCEGGCLTESTDRSVHSRQAELKLRERGEGEASLQLSLDL